MFLKTLLKDLEDLLFGGLELRPFFMSGHGHWSCMYSILPEAMLMVCDFVMLCLYQKESSCAVEKVLCEALKSEHVSTMVRSILDM